jgi:hypothetical protein
MKNFLNAIYKNQAAIYKGFLFVVTVAVLVYFFPKGSKFKYEIVKGKPWQYENYYAPFDFSILKSKDKIEKEKRQIKENHTPFFDYNSKIPQRVKSNLDQQFELVFVDSIIRQNGTELLKFAENEIDDIYQYGFIQEVEPVKKNKLVYLKKGNEVEEAVYKNILKQGEIGDYIEEGIESANLTEFDNQLKKLFFKIIKPNVLYNKELTEKDLKSRLNSISYVEGIVTQGSRIISKGEVVEGNKYQMLMSLKSEYESKVLKESSYNTVFAGYLILTCLAIAMLMLYIKKYRSAIFENNTKLTFIFFNILFVFIITVLVLRGNVSYVYIVPICILPLTLKAFFDARIAFITHVVTVLLLGFVVPNSYEYMFLHIIAGMMTVLSISELYRRANLFLTVGKITGIYILSYFAFSIIQEGNIEAINYQNFLFFILAGLATLFAQPLIYAYEKIFGLISDMSLLELSDTNSTLLKELSNKAPGTFHHSLNVANLAEASANEIGANAMLVRVGALYHDIGKMTDPTYFTENQTTSVNPHDEKTPQESADIIINHVSHGIEIAKRNNLPDRIIDFIRTHHGTTAVFYFYKKAQAKLIDSDDERGEVDRSDFQYKGPEPFSRETAILMMSDSVEAASKSLKEPTSSLIDEFVEKIINKQMEERQFLNATINFKEIQSVKKVLKQKLKNIYHLRIEYPE